MNQIKYYIKLEEQKKKDFLLNAEMEYQMDNLKF